MRALPTARLPARLFELLLLLLIHLFLFSLRRWIAPGFPARSNLMGTILGVLIETLLAWLLLRLVLGVRIQRHWLWPAGWDRRTAAGIVLGIGAGLFFFSLLFVLNALFPNLPEKSTEGISFWKQGLLVPAVEEIYFRMLLTGALLHRRWSATAAIPAGALIFALSHDYFVAPFLFPVGLAAGWLFARYGLWSSLLMHATYNCLILARTIQ